MSFDWQTEEDWPAEDTPASPGGAPQPRGKNQRRGRFWALLGMVLIIVISFVYLAWRVVNNRVTVATETVELDLFSSVTLVQETAVDQDTDLFLTFLSGRDDDWATAMETLVAEGALFDRPGFDLTWIEDPVETTVFSHTLSSDLLAAELHSQYRYAFEIGQGLTKTIELQQTSIFRQGPDRWLISPPEREYWGGRIEIQGKFLTVRFWERDEELGRRLAADLDATVATLCLGSLLACPDDLHLRFIFVKDPQALSFTPRSQLVPYLPNRINVPSPSLVGQPVNEAGYQALLYGYQAQLVAGVLSRVAEWECCTKAAYLQVIADWYLAEMGLRPFPYPLDKETPFPVNYSLNSGEASWSMELAEVDDAAREEAFVLIQFFMQELDIPAEALLRQLTPNGNYQTWLTAVTGDKFSLHELERRWLQYVFERSDRVVEKAPESFPANQSLYVVCSDQAAASPNLGLYRYTPEEGFLFIASSLFDYQHITALPDDQGLAVAGIFQVSGVDIGESYLWVDGHRTSLTWEEYIPDIFLRDPVAFPILGDPTGRRLLWTVPDLSGVSNGLLDINACLENGDCTPEALLAYPSWSPNGEVMLGRVGGNPLENEQDSYGFLTFLNQDGSLNGIGFGLGSSPFWIDTEQFGYIRAGFNGYQELVLGNVDSLEAQVLFTSDDLLVALPNTVIGPAVGVHMHAAQPWPANPDLLLIPTTISKDSREMQYLLTYDIATKQLIVRVLVADNAPIVSLGYRFSPDGRYFFFTTLNSENSLEWQIVVHDIAANITNRYPIYVTDGLLPPHWQIDWSAESEWMAFSSAGLVQLVVPAYDQIYPLLPPTLNCHSPAWVNR